MNSATGGTPRLETMKSMYQPGGATLAELGALATGGPSDEQRRRAAVRHGAHLPLRLQPEAVRDRRWLGSWWVVRGLLEAVAANGDALHPGPVLGGELDLCRVEVGLGANMDRQEPSPDNRVGADGVESVPLVHVLEPSSELADALGVFRVLLVPSPVEPVVAL